jgi:flagellar hook-associated protein 2
MTPISLGGLASGIDTDAIVKQLMAVEGQSKTRLQLADTKAAARQSGLKDLASKLGALRDAANALKSTTTWADVQKLASSDPARVSVRATGGTAPGARVIEVTALAVTAQHAFTFTASASPQTLTIGGFSLAVDADATVSTVAAAINDRDDAPVKAVVAGGKLVLTSRTGGAGGDFSVAANPLLAEDATYARAGSDAAYLLDGVAKTSSSNVITDANLGAEVTLKATTTAPVSLTVSDPAPDTDAIKTKVTAFVSAYNSAVDFIRGKIGEERVKNPTTNADAVKGLFRGDSLLSGVLGSMRSQFGDLSAYGISTGAASGSATFSADAVAGKLRVDDAKLTAALADPESLRVALNGLGQRLSDVVTPVAGARVTEALDGVSSERKRIADQITRTDVRLADKEQRLRAKFAAMESALAAGQAAQSQLAAQLTSLG